jgi:signal transduction histidine kinase
MAKRLILSSTTEQAPSLPRMSTSSCFDPSGVELVNPGFPTLEGRNLLDLKDTQGKTAIREMLKVVQTSGSGWVDYMWPKPGRSVSTQKSAYVRKTKLGQKWVLSRMW